MPNIADRIEPFVELADNARRGDLADLVTTEHPSVRLSEMTLAPATRAHLERVLHEQRRRELLESHGFAPLRRLLLTGPPGTGKSLTAAALATELSLPLVTVTSFAVAPEHFTTAVRGLRAGRARGELEGTRSVCGSRSPCLNHHGSVSFLSKRPPVGTVSR